MTQNEFLENTLLLHWYPPLSGRYTGWICILMYKNSKLILQGRPGGGGVVVYQIYPKLYPGILYTWNSKRVIYRIPVFKLQYTVYQIKKAPVYRIPKNLGRPWSLRPGDWERINIKNNQMVWMVLYMCISPISRFATQPLAREAQTHFRLSLLSIRKIAIFRRERSDDRKCVCASQATQPSTGWESLFLLFDIWYFLF